MWTSRNKLKYQSESASLFGSPQSENLSVPHLKRVSARIQYGCQIFDARILLNDISPEGLRLFSSLPVVPGDRVDITLLEPRTLAVKGLVVERFAPMRQGHILSSRSYPHRLSVRFEFSSEDERLAVAEFVNELFSQHGIRATGPVGGMEFRDTFV
ncbi:hypothetical protein EBZ37_07555 [bacterium]|nr:hypothetical protein [bacterium]